MRVIYEPDRGQRVPVRLWARDANAETIRQLQRLASQRFVVEFHPRVSLEPLVFFADAYAQARRNSLLAEQIPEGQGFFEASILGERIAQSGAHHAARDLHFSRLRHGSRCFGLELSAVLERSERLPVAPESQRPSHQAQKNRGPPEHAP